MTTIQPRTATIPIFQGDDLDEIEHLRKRAEAAADEESGKPARNGGEAVRLSREHNERVKQAEERAVNVKVQALGRRAWKALVAEHPPREDSETDKRAGVNEDTFQDELVAASIVEPEFKSRADLDAFTDQLRDIDFERVYLASFALNRWAGADPKPLAVSKLTPKNDAT